MIKRIIKISFALICCMCLNMKHLVNAESESVLEIVETPFGKLTEKGTIKAISNNNILLVTKEKWQIVKNSVVCFEKNSEYLTHIISGNLLIVAAKTADVTTIYKVSLSSYQDNSCLGAFSDVKAIIADNNYFWLLGSKDNDGAIAKYDFNLNEYSVKQYGGDGYECFNHAIIKDGNIYIAGTKDAHSDNGLFANVGSLGETKSFILQLDERDNITKIKYFNEQTPYEIITSFKCSANSLFVLLETTTGVVLFTFDNELTCYEKQVITECHIYDIVSESGYYLQLCEATPNKKLLVNGEELALAITGELVFLSFLDNVLYIYTQSGNYLTEYAIYEYHVNHFTDYLITKDNRYFVESENQNNTAYIEVASYLHKIDVYVEEITPFFDKQIAGEYEAQFAITINNNKQYLKKGQIIVEQDVNIIDEYIYPTGYMLKFYGYAMLDHTPIYSGYQLTTPGDYELVITDVNNNSITYHFKVVENYYASNCISQQFLDYYVNKNEEITLSINCTEPELVTKLVVNNEEVLVPSSKVTVKENEILFDYIASNQAGVTEILINGIYYGDAFVGINTKYQVMVLKDVPSLTIQITDAANLAFKVVGIEDNDLAILDIETTITEAGRIIKTANSYLQNQTISLKDLKLDTYYQIKLDLVYDLGDGNIKKVNFFNYEGQQKKLIDEFIKLDFTYQQNKLTDVLIDVQTANYHLELKQLKVGEQNLASIYQLKRNYTTLIICIFLTIISIGTLATIYYLKRRKEKGILN